VINPPNVKKEKNYTPQKMIMIVNYAQLVDPSQTLVILTAVMRPLNALKNKF